MGRRPRGTGSPGSRQSRLARSAVAQTLAPRHMVVTASVSELKATSTTGSCSWKKRQVLQMSRMTTGSRASPMSMYCFVPASIPVQVLFSTLQGRAAKATRARSGAMGSSGSAPSKRPMARAASAMAGAVAARPRAEATVRPQPTSFRSRRGSPAWCAPETLTSRGSSTRLAMDWTRPLKVTTAEEVARICGPARESARKRSSQDHQARAGSSTQTAKERLGPLPTSIPGRRAFTPNS
mmetsp:Transcript_92262/g.287197  ORF Transcript_92262/g.287197 Transcript_92262/m.287197 type:complete len:238 (-) Transcript_92262:162-875(-)